MNAGLVAFVVAVPALMVGLYTHFRRLD